MTQAEAAAVMVLERTVALAEVPAPSGAEAARAEIVARWWRQDGWAEVHTDPTGNVWARVEAGDGDSLVLCAHMDTVFPSDLPHVAKIEGDRLAGPSVGDDSVGVAALSAIGHLIGRRCSRPIWLLATVGEEGLGNLAGIRGALGAPPQPVGAVIAVEGNYLGKVSHTAAGSLRWRVEVSGPGGHAWEQSSAPSSIHAVASMVAALSALDVAGARTSVNVGRIGGGEAINARARQAWFELDLRADQAEALNDLEASARTTIDGFITQGLSVRIEELGRRPAGGIDRVHPLVASAVAQLELAGIAPTFPATSTDANAAHAAGIPAIAVGITSGSGEHTPAEWIDIPPIARGLQILADSVVAYLAGVS
jgi:acetylornithine deacetylase/succinyl-diaminopimelate desuccinylase-like protein